VIPAKAPSGQSLVRAHAPRCRGNRPEPTSLCLPESCCNGRQVVPATFTTTSSVVSLAWLVQVGTDRTETSTLP